MNPARLGIYGWVMLGLILVLTLVDLAIGGMVLAAMWVVSLVGVLIITAMTGVDTVLDMVGDMDLPGAVFLLPSIFFIGFVYRLMGGSVT